MTVSLQRSIPSAALPEPLVERVLAELGFSNYSDPTLDTLREIYGAWCQRVPFDNVRKMIHVSSGNPGPLPGSTPEDFLQSWLKFGTGGTCWSSADALHALLASLGFAAFRGLGTMLAAPDLPPNHGTVVVAFGKSRYIVDSSILHGEPLQLEEGSKTSVLHSAWGVRCGQRDGQWHIRWRPLNRLDGFKCRLDRFPVSAVEYSDFYEKTRAWSPFNYEVTARINRGESVVGIANGYSVFLLGDGSVLRGHLSTEERARMLVEDIGISEEIVEQLPQDTPTPPPPWSRTAQSLANCV